jgi:hypothetical protein
MVRIRLDERKCCSLTWERMYLLKVKLKKLVRGQRVE